MVETKIDKKQQAHQVLQKFCPSPMLGLKLHMVRIQRASNQKMLTLQGVNMSPYRGTFEDNVPFPKVGYVSSLEGTGLIFHLSVMKRWEKKHQSYTHHMKGDLWLYDSHKQNKWRFVHGTNLSHFTPNSEKQIWASTWFTCHAQQELWPLWKGP